LPLLTGGGSFPLHDSRPTTLLSDTTMGVEPVLLFLMETGPATMLPDRSSSPVIPVRVTEPMSWLSTTCTTSAPLALKEPITQASSACTEAPALTVTPPRIFAPSMQTRPSSTTSRPMWNPVMVSSQVGSVGSASMNRATPHRELSWKDCPVGSCQVCTAVRTPSVPSLTCNSRPMNDPACGSIPSSSTLASIRYPPSTTCAALVRLSPTTSSAPLMVWWFSKLIRYWPSSTLNAPLLV